MDGFFISQPLSSQPSLLREKEHRANEGWEGEGGTQGRQAAVPLC